MRKDNNNKTTADEDNEATNVDVDAAPALAVSDDNKNVQEEQFLSGYNYGMKKPAQLYDHDSYRAYESLLKILLIAI
jgi:hypothetical protein